MSGLLKWLLAPYAPGGWLCMSAVGEDDGGGDSGNDDPGEPEPPAQDVVDQVDRDSDDPGVDDGSEDDSDDDADADPDGQAPKVGRRQGRIERLNARLAAEKQARELAEAEAQRIRSQQPQAPARNEDQIEAEIQRQEEAAGLKYEQRLHNSAQRHLARTQQRQQQVENVLADKLDAIEFATECQGSEIARRHKDEVEKRLVKMRDSGRNAPRMGLLALIVGENVLKQSKGKQTSKRKDEAEARISQRRGEPPGNRSDASNRGGRKDDAKAREKRLLGQRI